MSRDQALKTLSKFGLSRIDSEIYLFLVKKGPQKGKYLTKTLNINRPQAYRSLKRLLGKGMVNSTIQHPSRFSAVLFEEILDRLIKTKMDEAQALQQEKKEILSILQSAEINENNDSAAKFMIVEGRSNVYHKLVRMISATRKQITAITGVPGLIRADSLGLFDIGLENQFRTEIHFRFITDLSNQYADAMKNLLKRLTNARINSEGRAIDLDAKLFPRFFIRDDKEMILFVTSSGDTAVSEREDVALWTDSETLLHAFNVVFEKLWEKSIAIHVKLNEI